MIARFVVPMVPPSVNQYVRHTRRGRHYVSKEAKEFKRALGIHARGIELRGKSYAVEICVVLGFGQRGDADNFCKCVVDGMVEAGVIDSDAKVTDLRITKGRDRKNPRTEITVRAN